MRRLITLMILGLGFFSCNNYKNEEKLTIELNKMKQEMDSLKAINQNNQIVSFLTFQDANAEDAMNFYIELFDKSKIIEVQRYQKGEPGKKGTIKMARFSLNGSSFMCSDSYIKHEWSFTPAISLYMEVETDEKISKLFEKLSEGGKVMMPLDNYGFSKKFGFVEDKFGVSWQLNLL
ncbi:MAG: VOC family protein [Carboxylicivirga sp.]|nr:VOC family protein [Carboxylicivirga sp.]